MQISGLTELKKKKNIDVREDSLINFFCKSYHLKADKHFMDINIKK